MKKKTGVGLCLFVIACLAGGSAQAGGTNPDTGQGYGAAGCGLGSLILGDKPGIVQIFAATTNGTSGNQTFGITSGTSNCEPEGRRSDAVKNYIEANRVALANDIARGHGEVLSNLSEVLGCRDTDRLGSTLQKEYGNIFSSEKVSSEELSRNLLKTVRQNRSLSTTCPVG